ncbi:MAG TPA: hypothetical protein VFZ61_04650 [Polyangiales bacterium]
MMHRSKNANVAALRADARAAGCAARLWAVCALPLAVGGCSVLTDTTKKQCEEQADCERLFGTDVPYQCQNNYCTRPSCESHAQCKELGFEDAICGQDQRCQIGCNENQDCGERMACNTASKTCESRECERADDCPGVSGSKTCNNGMCEDLTWGCIGEKDARAAAKEATATLKTTIVNANPRVPIPGVEIRVCRLAAYDPMCTKPLDVDVTYDDATGATTITGLQQDTVFRLKIDPPADSGLLPLDFYTQRPVRDVTEERPIVVLSEALARTLAGGFSPPAVIDPDEAALYLTAFDCQDRPAMGVALEVNKDDLTPGTQVGYLGDNGLVVSTLTSTGTAGQGNIVNLPADKLVALEAKVSDTVMSTQSVMPLARRNTTVRFYPRSYD